MFYIYTEWVISFLTVNLNKVQSRSSFLAYYCIENKNPIWKKISRMYNKTHPEKRDKKTVRFRCFLVEEYFHSSAHVST